MFLQHCLSWSSPPNFLIYFSCFFSFSLLSTFTHYFLLLCLLYFILYLRLFLILLHYIIFYILPFFLLLIHPPSPLNFLPVCLFYILPSLLYHFFILLLRLSFYRLPSVLLLLHSASTTHFSFFFTSFYPFILTRGESDACSLCPFRWSNHFCSQSFPSIGIFSGTDRPCGWASL
jgi:hypothetical protein